MNKGKRKGTTITNENEQRKDKRRKKLLVIMIKG